MPTLRLRLQERTPLRSMVLVWAYVAFGLGLSLAILSEGYPWDWNRAIIVILACVNAGLTAQTAILCGQGRVTDPLQRFGVNASSAWLLALAMLLLAGGFVSASATRSGHPPSSELTLPLIGGALTLLTCWSIARLQAVRRLGNIDG